MSNRPNKGLDVPAIGDLWRTRGHIFRRQASKQSQALDAIRLTAMATALEWAATELVVCAEGRGDKSAPKQKKPSRKRK